MAAMTTVEAYDAFHKRFAPASRYREYVAADEERLKNRLPEIARLILLRDGWASYRQQELWTCDPDLWASTARTWFPDASSAEVIARTAFGDLFVLVGQTYFNVFPQECTIQPIVSDPNYFYGDALVQKGYLGPPNRLRAAREHAGELEWDEMYTYVPALALGGDIKTSAIERVKAREQHGILAQLAPVRRL